MITIIMSTLATAGIALAAPAASNPPSKAGSERSPSGLLSRDNTTINATTNATALAATHHNLPPNSQSLFGGVDATRSPFTLSEIFKPNLFDLQSGSFASSDVYLDFIWDPKHVERGVSGETKQSYQQKLTSSYSIGADYAGFGAEVNLSFEEDSFDETDMKYAGLYIQEQTYTLRFSKTNSTDVRKHLSKNAKDSFAKDDAGTIVQRWGTHYLESATFGGMKRITSKVDIRDDSVSSSLLEALSIKYKAGDDGANAEISKTSETTQKLYKSMQTYDLVSIGGEDTGDNAAWLISLFNDPTITDFTIKPLADLIADPDKQAQVRDEVARVLALQEVRDDAKFQIMMSPMEWTDGIKSSGILGLPLHPPRSIWAMAPKVRPGWFRIAEFGFHAFGDNNQVNVIDAVYQRPGDYTGLLVREDPNFANESDLVPATNWGRTWGRRDGGPDGLYEMWGPDGYVSLSGFLFHDDGATILAADAYRMVKEEHTVLVQYFDDSWNSIGTGAEDSGTAKFYGGNAPGLETATYTTKPDGLPVAVPFHSWTGIDLSKGGWTRGLNFTRCSKVLKNAFLADISL